MKRSREPEDELLDYYSGDDSHDLDISFHNRRDSRSVEPAVKIIHLDTFKNNHDTSAAMRCSLPPHKEGLAFPSYDEFEAHYSKTHMNRCLECRKNFPSEHLLSVHIEECHDSFAAVRRERGERTVSFSNNKYVSSIKQYYPIPLINLAIGKKEVLTSVCVYLMAFLMRKKYSCFVENCERKCSTPQKRRMHMIDKHGYPRNYFFALTKEGIDGRRSLLIESGHRRRRSSRDHPVSPKTKEESVRQDGTLETMKAVKRLSLTPQAAGTHTINTNREKHEKPDINMEDLTTAISSLQFIPSSVRFGRRKRSSGFAK